MLLGDTAAGKKVKVESLPQSEEDSIHLRGIGIFENGELVVVRNELGSARPLLIEVFGARFMIERELTKQIEVSEVE